MPPFARPIVIVTRPEASAAGFVAALEAVAGPFDPLLSPAFAHAETGVALPAFEAAIFTSQAGVACAPEGAGRVAWCVGRKTAEAATKRGYEAHSADGDAEDLAALILARRPQGRLLHLRGEVTRGDIAGTLAAAGLNCAERIVYRKAPCAPAPELAAALAGKRPLILPLFSGETVSILAGWNLDFSETLAIAMSGAVAEAAAVLTPMQITIAEAPDQAAMVAATARMIA